MSTFATRLAGIAAFFSAESFFAVFAVALAGLFSGLAAISGLPSNVPDHNARGGGLIPLAPRRNKDEFPKPRFVPSPALTTSRADAGARRLAYARVRTSETSPC